jgi:glycosyltransferase involved in cell wall biosynthesis
MAAGTSTFSSRLIRGEQHGSHPKESSRRPIGRQESAGGRGGRAGCYDEFTRSVGWCSLDDLPRHNREADICLMPTIAQDSLSRTSVEATASGIPVIASRIGGLPYTVTDGVTGLLFEPGDPIDLARKIARLHDDPELRQRMGLAGRKRFRRRLCLGGCD